MRGHWRFSDPPPLFVAVGAIFSTPPWHGQVTTKASLVGHRFLPKESTGSRDTLLVHNAAFLAGVYEAAVQF